MRLRPGSGLFVASALPVSAWGFPSPVEPCLQFGHSPGKSAGFLDGTGLVCGGL